MADKSLIRIDLGCKQCLQKVQQLCYYASKKNITAVMMKISKDPDHDYYHIEEVEHRRVQ